MTDNDVTAFHVAVELFDAMDRMREVAAESPDVSTCGFLETELLDRYRDRIATYRNIVTRWGERGDAGA